MARSMISSFWERPKLNVNDSFVQFFDLLVYTYKDWGSDPHVFDVFFQLIPVTCTLTAFKDCDKTAAAIVVFRSFLRISEAHHLLLLMELKGYTPDVVSYSTVVNGYCRFGELEKVWKLIEVMKDKGLKPNSYTYGSVILLLCRSCKLAEAEEAFREMIRQGIVPDTVVYTTLIDGFCKRGNIRAASKFFHEMLSLDIAPDVLTYTAVISGFCRVGDMVEAGKLFHEMLCRGLEPDSITFTEVINGYCKAGQEHEGGLVLYRGMVEKGFSVSASTYSALIKGFFKRKKFVEAREVFEQMKREGLAGDKEIFDFFSDVRTQKLISVRVFLLKCAISSKIAQKDRDLFTADYQQREDVKSRSCKEAAAG
ncbi:hypothetical protein Bca52824_061818 [Brassica carinata]|uniref:Pentatricopeptide repeat-containing protein n=1 Tax=Brassica carinata TaxID=52824 RepID=A0A8X7QC86_BRACI|nr:hypothetical protein Bca52824_061818 [Brassica carinata]